jgi:hypothetical protein
MPVEAEDIPEEEGVAGGGSGEERANMVGGTVEDGEVYGGREWSENFDEFGEKGWVG